MQTHELFMHQYAQLRDGNTQAQRDEIAQYYGINGECLFARLRSIDLPSSFPYNIMHLFFENLVPNMVKHWIGEFKGLDEGKGAYKISKEEWIAIGTLPDIAQDRGLYKAEAYSFWIQYLAPILLKGRLMQKYYNHAVELRKIILLCLQFKISRAEIDELQQMINNWVLKYKAYVNFSIDTTINIERLVSPHQTGPLWASWAFVMERFCGRLLPAVKNRTRPYTHLDNYIKRRAQLQIVASEYNMPSLMKAQRKHTYAGNVPISTQEVVYPDLILGRPIHKKVTLDIDLKRQMVAYFSLVYPGRRANNHGNSINASSLVRYGQFRIHDGDLFRTAIMIDRDSTARDNSYVKYDLCPDRHANFRRQLDRPLREVQYGRLLDIYYVEYIKPDDGAHVPYLLARVTECVTGGVDAARRGTPLVRYNRELRPRIIHIETIVAVIGRVHLGDKEWAIIDRSRDGARTQFLDDDGNIDLDVDNPM
ncbi:hypothetical protein RhiTH_010611 [Rhizoctonia solani]